MSDADLAEILKMPPEERMKLLEIIWASLAADPSSVPLGDAHRQAISDRVAEYQANPDDVVSKDEVFSQARKG
jgi:putative addiction module component (TIGR02574 family)